MACLGSNGMLIDCGERVNLAVYRQQKCGALVRVAGRFRSDGVLTTTDAGIIIVEWASSETLFAEPACFVEVVGTKVTNERMRAVCIVKLPSDDVDEELWNEAIMLTQMRELRHLFLPSEERSRLAEPGRSEVHEQEPMSQTQEYGLHADSGELLRLGVDDVRGVTVPGVADGAEQEPLSPTETLGQRSEREAMLEAELDVLLSRGM